VKNAFKNMRLKCRITEKNTLSNFVEASSKQTTLETESEERLLNSHHNLNTVDSFVTRGHRSVFVAPNGSLYITDKEHRIGPTKIDL